MPLRITVELIPHGNESRKSVIGTLDITNTGRHPHRPEFGEYRFMMTGPVYDQGRDEWHRGELSTFRRSRGYWSLVKEILNQVDCDCIPIDEA